MGSGANTCAPSSYRVLPASCTTSTPLLIGPRLKSPPFSMRFGFSLKLLLPFCLRACIDSGGFVKKPPTCFRLSVVSSPRPPTLPRNRLEAALISGLEAAENFGSFAATSKYFPWRIVLEEGGPGPAKPSAPRSRYDQFKDVKSMGPKGPIAGRLYRVHRKKPPPHLIRRKTPPPEKGGFFCGGFRDCPKAGATHWRPAAAKKKPR